MSGTDRIARVFPLVSCIMPTRDRRSFIPDALRGFLAQDYPNLELIIVDDGTDQVQDLLPPDDRITYVRMGNRETLGEKRNIACHFASGDFVVHFDDDDWYSSARVRLQVNTLIDQDADVCGSSLVYYRDVRRGRGYKFSLGNHWSFCGTTLAYRREAWERGPFLPLQVGEDTAFVIQFPFYRIIDLCDPTLFVCTIHGTNVASARIVGQPSCFDESLEEIEGIMVARPDKRSLRSARRAHYRSFNLRHDEIATESVRALIRRRWLAEAYASLSSRESCQAAEPAAPADSSAGVAPSQRHEAACA